MSYYYPPPPFFYYEVSAFQRNVGERTRKFLISAVSAEKASWNKAHDLCDTFNTHIFLLNDLLLTFFFFSIFRCCFFGADVGRRSGHMFIQRKWRWDGNLDCLGTLLSLLPHDHTVMWSEIRAAPTLKIIQSFYFSSLSFKAPVFVFFTQLWAEG